MQDKLKITGVIALVSAGYKALAEKGIVLFLALKQDSDGITFDTHVDWYDVCYKDMSDELKSIKKRNKEQ